MSKKRLQSLGELEHFYVRGRVTEGGRAGDVVNLHTFEVARCSEREGTEPFDGIEVRVGFVAEVHGILGINSKKNHVSILACLIQALRTIVEKYRIVYPAHAAKLANARWAGVFVII